MSSSAKLIIRSNKLQEEIANKLTFYTFKEDFAQKDRYLQEKFMKINIDITRNEQALIGKCDLCSV